ncbi:MAG: OsmC family protein [Gaiellaceae bacterium]
MEARQVPAGEGRLVGEAHGEIENEDGVLVIKRIHVRYRLRLDTDADREKVQRAFEHHMPKCPVYRSVGGCIDVTTSLEVNE